MPRRDKYTTAGAAMPMQPKPLELNHPNCIDRRACDGVALEPTRQKVGICKACMDARAAGVEPRADMPSRWNRLAAARARGTKASANATRGRKRMNTTFVSSETARARARDHADAQAKRSKPKRMKEQPESGLQVIGVRYIGKRAKKAKAA